MNGGSQTRESFLSKKKEARIFLLIELSRLRIESFFALPFCSYGSWVGIRVMVRKSFQIFFASPER